MSKIVQILAVFSTISSRLYAFGPWPYKYWPPEQLAAYRFYIMPGKEGDPIACFFCRKEWHCRCSTKLITDRQLLRMHNAECLWADMLQDIIGQPSSVITRLMNYPIVAQPPQEEPEIDSSPSPHRSSPLPSPLPTANTASCETASDLSSSTSADSLHTRSDNTPPPCQYPQSTSQNPISDQDMSVPTVVHFVTEFSLSGLPAHSKFLLSVEGGQISAQIRCDYCVNDEARLDGRAHGTS
jgi:hypothetical protein